MFHSARIKLTAWYLLIIMLISIAFSVAIYRVLISEIDRVEKAQRLRIERRFPQLNNIPQFDNKDELWQVYFLDPQLVIETKRRLKLFLLLVDLFILAGSAAAGYFLAGKTLEPIENMVYEQKQFITNASHELRTPLTSLKTEIEINLRDNKLNLVNAKKLLKSNLEEVDNLQSLSDKLIKLSRYQGGENGLSVSEVSLKSIISDSIKLIEKLAKSKKISIENKITDYNFEGNKQSLIELFVILLDNAIKYSPVKSSITVNSKKSDGHLLISVADQGIGIDKSEIPNLFKRFYRADKSRTKTEVHGYGLGLSIAKQITERHNGQIKVKSETGKGSTFTVHIPIKHFK